MNETTGRQWIDFEELKKTASVKAVLSFLGLLDDMELVGGEWKGQCPFHKGDNKKIKPFSFSRDKRAFYCHVCKRKGNVLDFVKQYLEWKNKEKVGVRDAAEYIVSAMEHFTGIEEEGEGEREEGKENTPDVEAVIQETRTKERQEEKHGEASGALRAKKKAETEKREREEGNSVLEELNPEYFLDFVDACKLVSLKGASPRDFIAVRVEFVKKIMSLLALTTR